MTAQRLVPQHGAGVPAADLDFPVAPIEAAKPPSPVELATVRARMPLRIPVAVITSHPILRGEKSFLRALRAAEEKAWNANRRLSLAGVLLPVLVATFAML